MMFFSTLPRYITKKYLIVFTLNFLIIVALIFLVDFSENVRRFSNVSGYSMTITAMLSALRIFDIIQISIPFVVLIASISALIALNRKYELVVARAVGLSVWQFLMPIIICNFIIGILSITILNPVGASATRLANEIASEVGFGQRLDTIRNNAPWIRQLSDGKSTIIGGRSSSQNGTVLYHVTLLRFDEKKAIKDRIEADKAILSDGFWLLENARISVRGEAVKRESEFKVKTNLQAEFIAETFSSADQVSFFELPDKIKAARSFGLKANGYIMKLHQLIALPAFLVAMTFIAAMVSLDFVRLGQSLYAVVGGILCGFLLYVISEFMTAFGEAGSLSPLVAAWMPIVLASTLGITVLLHKEDG